MTSSVTVSWQKGGLGPYVQPAWEESVETCTTTNQRSSSYEGWTSPRNLAPSADERKHTSDTNITDDQQDFGVVSGQFEISNGSDSLAHKETPLFAARNVLTPAERQKQIQKREWVSTAKALRQKARLAEQEVERAASCSALVGPTNLSQIREQLEHEAASELEAMEYEAGDRIHAIKQLVAHCKAHVGNMDFTEEAEYVTKLTRLMDQGEGALAEFKAIQRTNFERLLSEEQSVEKDLHLFAQRLESWAQGAEQAPAGRAGGGAGPRGGPGLGHLPKATCDPHAGAAQAPEVLQLEKFLSETGINGGQESASVAEKAGDVSPGQLGAQVGGRGPQAF
ncbi:hypothetical protein CYMTET_29513 [Cymbomonas tetramitiformis]|uniref:Uncharacterized protein n=1 Tax=Cymbomonas tetramitiformis TaxID=36881 RepID=A0AAE0FL21_9CHLO|nr:hypothetical protein CYMTET_29513 [Cymbomonas tetramitiformis]